MGWSVGYDTTWHRDIGYGVPAVCDQPSCDVEIDRGLAYVCGSEPFGGEFGCGLYFCEDHLGYRVPRRTGQGVMNCARCRQYRSPYKPKPDVREWVEHKLTDESWQSWRDQNPVEVEALRTALAVAGDGA
jgi:hypothetical protein